MSQATLLSFFGKKPTAGSAGTKRDAPDASAKASNASSSSTSSSSVGDNRAGTGAGGGVGGGGVAAPEKKKARTPEKMDMQPTQAAASSAAPTPLKAIAGMSFVGGGGGDNNGSSSSGKNNVSLRFANGLRIHLVDGDITRVVVDAVVSPSDTFLQSSVGVAGALVKREGTRAIPEACAAYRASHPKPSIGDVVPTTAGSLPFARILHACTPSFDIKTGATPLINLVSRVLAVACAEGAVSMSFPALGAGNGGFNVHMCADAIVTAVRDFDFGPHPRARLADVVVVLCSAHHETFQEVLTTFDTRATMIRGDAVHVTASTTAAAIDKKLNDVGDVGDDDGDDGDDNDAGGASGGGNTLQPSRTLDDMYGPIARSASFDATSGQMSIEAEHLTLGSQRLIVTRNDITESTCQIIVNAANSKLGHWGGVARIIVKKGGDVIQEESDAITRKRGEIKTGDVAVTSGGILKCQHVFHAVGPVWSQHSPDTCDKLLASCVTRCLEEAHKRHLFSIAIPAISSGIYGFPKDRCAKVMVSAAAKWCTEWMDSSVREVQFTNIDSATTEVFKKEFVSRFGSAFS